MKNYTDRNGLGGEQAPRKDLSSQYTIDQPSFRSTILSN